MNENNRAEALLALLEAKQYNQLMNILDDMNAIDIAEALESLPFENAVLIYRMLKKDCSVDVFAELPTDMQERIIASVTDQELAVLIEELYVDDAVDMLEELPAHVVKRVLHNANPGTRRLINQFLHYPEDSAGSIMTAEMVHLHKDMTVEQAVQYIRNIGLEKETVYWCYVTDPTRVLEGLITIKDLIFANPEDKISDLMEEDIIFARTTDDREQVANLITRYDLLALPVVDGENRLVGIVTVDDAVDVMEEEATEDFEKMAAMLPSEKPYLKTGVFTHAKNRIGWLLLLMLSSMITVYILSVFEAAFAAVPLLAFSLTMISNTGGNAGAQSSTTIIRGMTLGEIDTKDWLKVLWKECRVGVMVGGILAVFNFIRLLLGYSNQLRACLAISLSVLVSVVIAKTIGCLLPFVAKLLKQDPAVMATPLITTIVDASTTLVYFTIASLLLGISLS
jgi:magnesium transporter